MEYPIYISETKLDALYPQLHDYLPESRKHEVKLSLDRIFGGTFSATEKLASARALKLSVLQEYFETKGRNEGEVGDIFCDTSYVADTLNMRWSIFTEGRPEHVYFGAEVETTVIGLVGSAKHVLAVGRAPRSAGASLGCGVEKLVQNQLTPLDKVEAVLALNETLPRDQQVMRFVAKVLVREHRAGRRVILATPIFVSLT